MLDSNLSKHLITKGVNPPTNDARRKSWQSRYNISATLDNYHRPIGPTPMELASRENHVEQK